jgi:Sulfotransferase family
MSAADRPIFLVGCPRSGTTLLSAMLHAHPRIAIPPETRFLLPAYEDRSSFGDLRDRANRVALAERITGRGSRFKDLGLDRGEVIEAIADGPPTLGSAMGIVWREFAESRGKARWGEKRPGYWRYMDVVNRLFPTAQVIHLVRDPRACVASLQKVTWLDRKPEVDCAVWVLADQEIRRFGRRVGPDSYYALRYEDLLADRKTALTGICTFLGEAFDEAMLDHVVAAGDIVPDRKTWHDRTKADVDPSRIEAWRDELAPADVGLIERVARHGMRIWGYAASEAGRRPSPASLARVYAELAHRRAGIERDRVESAVRSRTSTTPPEASLI